MCFLGESKSSQVDKEDQQHVCEHKERSQHGGEAEGKGRSFGFLCFLHQGSWMELLCKVSVFSDQLAPDGS